MGKRGRPLASPIRQNIIEILHGIGAGYGYDIYKIYISRFPKVTLRSIYYHLSKGVAIGVFKVERVEQSRGNYSWGGSAEKTYYSLGPLALPEVRNGKEGTHRIYQESQEARPL